MIESYDQNRRYLNQQLKLLSDRVLLGKLTPEEIKVERRDCYVKCMYMNRLSRMQILRKKFV